MPASRALHSAHLYTMVYRTPGHMRTQKAVTRASTPALAQCTLALPSVASSHTVALVRCMPAPAFCPTFTCLIA